MTDKRYEDERFYEAVRQGVADAIKDLAGGRDFYKAVSQGVSDAIWRVATNATDMPCADFYDFIKQGIVEALKDRDL